MDGGQRFARQLGRLLDAHAPAAPAPPIREGLTEAAVLVPVYLSPAGPHVVLTRRRAELRRHAGEISFPGGRRDRDDPSLLHTALRETEEEIGLPAAEVSPAGSLRPTATFVTGYAIHPFVGAIAPGRRFRPSPEEVEEVLQLPLRRLRSTKTSTRMTRRGFTFETEAYMISGHTIWGATARILDDLLQRLAPLL